MLAKKNLLFSLMIILSFLTGCAIPGSGSTPQVEDQTWELVSYAGTTPLPGATITVEFDEGQIQGSGGCNSFFGSYQINGSSLEVNQLAWTEMACLDPEGVMDQEQRVLGMLGEAEKVHRDDNRLVITTAGNRELVYKAQP